VDRLGIRGNQGFASEGGVNSAARIALRGDPYRPPMFEPQNDIERMLLRASADPAARPGFALALMDAEIFLVLISEDGPIVTGPDGKAVIPEGTRLTLASVVRGEDKLLPFFTAPSRARSWYKGEHIVAPERTRDLFGRFPDAPYALNPGSDFAKDFTPGEVQRMLAGLFDEGPQTRTTEPPEKVLLVHPGEIPEDLVAALRSELGATKSVRGAWLMLAMRAGQPERSWMLGVDHDGSWDDVLAAIGRAVAGDVLKGRILDAKPLDDGSLSSTLRTGIPVIAVNRGFLKKLFR
jgi:SseB protein C-terminal domain/SseB protein N-terminal domain